MALKVPWLRRRVDRKPIGCCQRLIAACLAISECVARPDVKKIVCFIRRRPLVPTRIFGRLPRLHGHAERLVLAECRAKKKAPGWPGAESTPAGVEEETINRCAASGGSVIQANA